MTATPNDAAVNAESAAKLVSELKKIRSLTRGETSQRLPLSGLAVIDDSLSILIERIERIERHATPQTQTGWMIEFTPMPKPLWYTGGLHKRQEPYATNNAIEAKRLRLDNLWGSKTFTPNFTDDPCKAAVYLTEGAAKSVLAELHASGKLMGEDCYIVTEHEWPSTPQTQATHGEGEAKCGRCGAIARSDDEIATHECAPSPTAAPQEKMISNISEIWSAEAWEAYWVGVTHGKGQAAAPALGELAKLYDIASEAVCIARNTWHEAHEENWLEDSDSNMHPDEYIGRSVVDALRNAAALSGDAKPQERQYFDLQPYIDAAKERVNIAVDDHIRAELIKLGWTPPGEQAAQDKVDARYYERAYIESCDVWPVSEEIEQEAKRISQRATALAAIDALENNKV